MGDVRSGPWRAPDGSVFYEELVCPDCLGQVVDPFDPAPADLPSINQDAIEKLKEIARSKRLQPKGKEGTVHDLRWLIGR